MIYSRTDREIAYDPKAVFGPGDKGELTLGIVRFALIREAYRGISVTIVDASSGFRYQLLVASCQC